LICCSISCPGNPSFNASSDSSMMIPRTSGFVCSIDPAPWLMIRVPASSC
jgi:hypothetical protein